MRPSLFFIVLILYVVILADAQQTGPSFLTEQPIFQRLTNKDGLSQGTINSIIQDRQGFMWFGTMDGLNRFDGYDVKVFRNIRDDSTSISSNIVNQIVEDKNGLLYIATGNGLNIYNPINNIFKPILFNALFKYGKNDAINCMTLDQLGLVWLGTQNNGVICYNPVSSVFHHFIANPNEPNSLLSNSISAIFADSFNNIWLSFYTGGISMFDPATGQFTNYCQIPENPNYRGLLIAYCFAETADHKLLIGLQDASLLSFDSSTKKINRVIFKNSAYSDYIFSIRSLAGSTKDTLWVGTDGDGLVCMNQKNGDFSIFNQGNSDNNLSYNTIKSLYADRDNNLWIGTYGKGINILSPYSKQFHALVQSDNDLKGLSFSSVRSVFEDNDGNLWVGGYNGFDKIDSKGEKTNIGNSLIIYSICEDPGDSNILWLGSEGQGLFKYYKSINKFESLSFSRSPGKDFIVGSGVYKILSDNKGAIYFGTNSGLNILNTNTGKFQFFANNPGDSTSIVPGSIISIFIADNEEVWVGSMNGGLSRFNKEKGTFTRFFNIPEDTKSLSGNRVNCIFEDEKGRLWIGTNMGLNLMNRETGKFLTYTEQDGLANNFIYGILEDIHGNLWLSSNKGISKFEPELKKFTNFDVGDGLPGNEFNTGAFFKKNNERFYFGGIDGLVAFNPNKIVKNPIPPKVVFTRFLKSNNEFKTDTVISFLNVITLQPDDLMVTFEFSALSYVNPDNCKYAYMVKNLSDVWINLGNKRSVMLGHLSPGEYFLKVKASNNDGIWNESPATLKIIVLPRFYEKIWFKLLGLIIMLGIIFTIFIIRIRLIRKQQQRLQSLVTVRTHELKDAIDELADEIEERKKTASELQEANTTKDKFFSIIAHDLKSPFNALLGFSDLLVEQWADLEDTEKFDFIKGIKKTSENTYNLVVNLLEWARLQKGNVECNPAKTNLKNLSKISVDQLQAHAEMKAIALYLDIPDCINAFADPNMIDFVFRNLLSNAIKFTPRNGQVFISAKIHENRVICRVEDSGTGMTRETVESLFKLENTISSSGTEGEAGTGLGLILCKEFIKKNRGSIWVESIPEKGSKFFFSLPVSEHL